MLFMKRMPAPAKPRVTRMMSDAEINATIARSLTEIQLAINCQRRADKQRLQQKGR